MLSAARQLELSMFSKVWQSPYLDVFKAASVYEGKNVRLVGNVDQVLDSTLGKRVFQIKGAVSASNYMEIPAPEKRAAGSESAQRSLGLTGKYLYFQLKSYPGAYFAVHIDLVTATGLAIRLSLSNIYKTMKVQNNGRVVQVPVTFLSEDRWTVLAVHLPSVLDEAHQMEIKARQNANQNNPSLVLNGQQDKNNRPQTASSISSLAGPAAFDYSFVKSVQICSSLSVRTVATSNQRFSIGTLPRELRFPINGGSSWDDHYDWFWVGQPPPVDPTEVAQIQAKKPKPMAKPLANQDINIAANARAPMATSSTGVTVPNVEIASADASAGQENRRVRSSDSGLSPDPILDLYKIIGYTPKSTRNIAFSPDGESIVYPSGNVIIVSDVKTGSQRFLTGHTAAVNLMQFSNGGNLLASGQEGRQPLIRIWNYQSGATLGYLMAHASDLKSVAFSPDDSMLAAVGKDASGRQCIIVWDLSQIESGKAPIIARQTSEYSINKILFSPFRDEFITLISCGHENIRFWRIKNRHLNGSSLLLNEHARNTFTDMAFEARFGAADQMSKRLFVSTASGSVFQVNYADRVLECIFKLHSGPINSIAINEGFCVTGSDDSFLRVWPLDFSDFYLQAQHKGSIVGVDIAMDGLHVLVGTASGCIGILDLTSTAYQTRIRSHLDSIFCVAFDPQRDEFATVSKDGTIRIWGLHSLEQIYEFYSPHESALCVAYHPDPKEYRLACGFSSGSMRVMDIASTSMFVDYQQHTGRVLDLVFSKNGKYLYSNGEEGNVCCYDVERNYLPIKMFTTYRNNSFALGPRNAIAGLNAAARRAAEAASPYLAFASNSSASGSSTPSSKGDVASSPLPPHALAISPDDSLLATIGPDANTVVLFEAPSFRQLRTFHSGHAPIASVRFNPLEAELCLVLSDSSYQRFDLHSGEMLHHIRPINSLKFKPEKQIKEKSSGVTAIQNPLLPRALSASLSQYANYLFVATSEPVLRVFDYYSMDPNNAPFQSFSCHGQSALSPLTGAGIHSLQPSQDGKFLVSVGGESVWIWRFRGSEKSPQQLELLRIEEDQRKERERIAEEEREKNFEEYYDEETGEIRLRRKKTPEELAAESGEEKKEEEPVIVETDNTPLSCVQYRPPRTDAAMRPFSQQNNSAAYRAISVLGFGGHGRSNLVWAPQQGFFAYSVGQVVVFQRVTSQALSGESKDSKSAARASVLLDRHTTEVSTLALSGDGNFLVSGASVTARDREFGRVWDLREPGKCSASLYFEDDAATEFHAFGTQSLCFDPSGTLVVALSSFVPGRGSLLSIWHWSTRRCLAKRVLSQPTHGLKWTGASIPALGIAASQPSQPLPKEKFLLFERAHFVSWGAAGVLAHAVHGSEIATQSWIESAECGADIKEIHALNVSTIQGRAALLLATRCGYLMILDTNANLLHRSHCVAPESGDEIVSLTALAQSRLAVACRSGALHQYSLESTEGSQVNVTHTRSNQFHSFPCGLALDPAGVLALVGTSDGSLWFANLPRDHKTRLIASSAEHVHQVAFTPNRKFLSAVAADGSLRVFLLSPTGASSIVHYQVSGAVCTAVAHHPTLEEVSAAYSDGSIRVLELSSLTVKRSIRVPSSSAITSLVYMNDGRTLVGGSSTGFVFAVAVELSLIVPSSAPSALSSVSPHSAHIGHSIDSISVSPVDPNVWLVTDRRRNVSVWKSKWFAGEATNWKGFLNENSHQLLAYIQPASDSALLPELASIPTCAAFSSTRADLVFMANLAAAAPVLVAYDLGRSAQVAKLQLAAWPTAMAISADDSLVAIGDAARVMAIYELADALPDSKKDENAPITSVRLNAIAVVPHSGSVSSVSFAPDTSKREFLIASASSGLVRLSAVKKPNADALGSTTSSM